ncbi:MAG: hypothetical protein QOH63_3981 [Acidobacteriota bacterium]|jgi:hypothetical protein|nr:hypothetical protein [Acidobacteriota bacterium]
MNLQKVKEIIEFYKKHFHAICKEEIYKWRAVKRFQDNWNIGADDFVAMLEDSLNLSRNLLDSGNYYPKRMLLLNAGQKPEIVRKLFNELYNEEKDWIERIIDFKNGMASLTKINFRNHRQSYQDPRAILVYLTLRFPDTYFFYKYTMFEAFIEKVDHPYIPKTGAIENLRIYFNLCELLKEEIIKDAELIKLHKQRITENEYFDKSFNILTQDVIYAAVRHIERFEKPFRQEPALKSLIEVKKSIISKPDKISLKGSFPNYIENEKAKKRIGDLGEQLVFRYEQEKLRKLGSKKEPVYIAKTKGDGEGYDILSFDEWDEEIFIEVKTTTSNYDAPFYITRNELEKSINEKERFCLYRLFDFDEKERTAKFYVQQGSLEYLCINPVLYRVRVEEKKASESLAFPAGKL